MWPKSSFLLGDLDAKMTDLGVHHPVLLDINQGSMNSKKLQIYNDQHKELLMKYTPTHPKVKNMEQKIDEIKIFIRESIATSKRDITTKREEIEKKIVKAEVFFEVIPEREKKLHILEREFHLKESMYNFLSDKKMEAAIAESDRFINEMQA